MLLIAFDIKNIIIIANVEHVQQINSQLPWKSQNVDVLEFK